jgi:RsmE family RNA methyltransferase
MNLILFEAQELGKALPKNDERVRHLLHVLRKKQGDTFEAGILGSGNGVGRIEAIGGDGSLAFSVEVQSAPLPRLPIHVGVGFPRPIQIRRLLRDLSSLGIESIAFFGTELGEKSYRDTKLFDDGGARAALVEGAAQSRDATLPEVRLLPSLSHWLLERPWLKGKDVPSPPPLLVAPDNVRPEGAMSALAKTQQSVVIAIGCERGWSDNERALLKASGFARLSLGSRALRTETACVVAATLAIEKIGALV